MTAAIETPAQPRGAEVPAVPATRWRLGSQIVLGFLAIALTVAGVTGSIVWTAERAYLIDHLQLEHERAFSLLQTSLLDDVISEDIPRIELSLRQFVARDPAVFSIELANEGGVTLFSSRRPAQRPAALLSFYEPITHSGERFGTLAVDWDNSDAERQILVRASTIALAVGATCAALGLLFFLLVQMLVIRPIDAISARLAAIQSGAVPRNEPLPATSAVELQRLDESVDALGEVLALKDRRESELRQARDLADQASRVKSEFLANVSHELRTPLNAINGFSEVMRLEMYGPISNTRYRAYAEDIHESGQHLLAVINDILDVAKVEAGKLELHFEAVNVADMVALCLDTMGKLAERANLRIAVSLADGLPRVWADALRVRQILLNLLSNAIKFTPSGGRVRLSVTWHETLGAIITVSDTGIGIPQHKLATVIEPFGQVESMLSRRYRGTGLGLPLVKAFVELHGGSLSLTSEVGAGTEVRFNLPPGRAPQAPQLVAGV
jgi:signal transduction histidine kinase